MEIELKQIESESQTKGVSLDYIIVEKFKESSDRSSAYLSFLFKRYRPLIVSMARKQYPHCKQTHSFMDTIQDVNLMMMETVNWVDLSKVNNKKAFSIPYILNLLWMNNYNALKTHERIEGGYMVACQQVYQEETLVNPVALEAQHQDLIDRIFALLEGYRLKNPKREKTWRKREEIFKLYFVESVNQRKISKIVGLSHQAVSLHVVYLKKLLKKEISTGEYNEKIFVSSFRGERGMYNTVSPLSRDNNSIR